MTKPRVTQPANREAITILELLVALVVVAGLLVVATVSIPRRGHGRDRIFRIGVMAAFHAVDEAQERFFIANGRYASALSQLDSIGVLDPVSIVIRSADERGWRAEGTHAYFTITCQATKSRSAAGAANEMERECPPGGTYTQAYRDAQELSSMANALNASVPAAPDSCSRHTLPTVGPVRLSGPEDPGYQTQSLDQPMVRRLLLDRNFDALDSTIEKYVVGTRRDYRMEVPLWDAHRVFMRFDSTLRAPLEEWVRTRPNSANARVALAHHLRFGRGHLSDWRVGRFQVDTALRLSPCNVIAYHYLMIMPDNAAHSGRLMAEALKVQPNSFLLRARHMYNLRPRGDSSSYEPMHQFARESQQGAETNPRLRALLGFAAATEAAAEEGRGNRSRALELYTQAISHGDFWEFLVERGQLYNRLDRWADAIADFDRTAIQRPQHPEMLSSRARAKYNLAREVRGPDQARLWREAWRDVEEAARLDPTDHDIKVQVAFYARHIPEFRRPAGDRR